MTTKRCPACSEVMVQEPYVINGETVMFWVCPEGDWEEPVNALVASVPADPGEEA